MWDSKTYLLKRLTSGTEYACQFLRVSHVQRKKEYRLAVNLYLKVRLLF